MVTTMNGPEYEQWQAHRQAMWEQQMYQDPWYYRRRPSTFRFLVKAAVFVVLVAVVVTLVSGHHLDWVGDIWNWFRGLFHHANDR